MNQNLKILGGSCVAFILLSGGAGTIASAVSSTTTMVTKVVVAVSASAALFSITTIIHGVYMDKKMESINVVFA